MLNDPRWNSEPSLAGFALFVASKEPSERYNWSSCATCAVAQYLASIGRRLALSEWVDDLYTANILARGSHNNNGRIMPAEAGWTFGQLADRILAYQMGEPVAA